MSILFTAWAAIAASRAARAADKAVEITERTSKQQLRAYINVSDFVMGSLDPSSASFTIKNRGQTPASNVLAWHKLMLAKVETDFTLHDSTGSITHRFHFGREQEANVFGFFHPELTKEEPDYS